MAITPEIPGSIDAPNTLTGEAAGSVAVPATLTPESQGAVAVPNSLTAETQTAVAVPATLTSEAAGVVAVPNSLTAEAQPTVAVPNAVTAQAVAAFPRALTPTLDLDFKSGLFAQNGNPKAQSDLLTYSRNSSASFIDRYMKQNGDWNYFLNNNFVGTVTNRLTYSEQFDDAAWTKASASISANNTKDPLGGFTGDKFSASSTATLEPSISQSITSVAAVAYTVSLYVKKEEARFLQIFFVTGHVANNPRINFDITNGLIGSQDADIDAASITPVGNDWFRVSATVIAVGTTLTTNIITIKTASDARSLANAWTSGDGLYVWGAQIDSVNYLTPYVKSISSITAETFAEVLRVEYDAETGQNLGALVEGSTTNLSAWSEAFDNASWAKSSATITANSATSPDNTSSADKLVAGSTATIAPYVSKSVVTVAANSYTVSFFAKRSEASFVQIFFGVSDVANNPRVNFDLSSGVIGTQDADIESARIRPAGNDWFRVSATVTAVDTSFVFRIAPVKTASDTRNQSNAWASGEGLLLWGAQLEALEIPTSYVRTEGATVSRLADLLSTPIAGSMPSGDVTVLSDTTQDSGLSGVNRFIFSASGSPLTDSASFNSAGSLIVTYGSISNTIGTAGLYFDKKLISSYTRSTQSVATYSDGVLIDDSDAGTYNEPDTLGTLYIGRTSSSSVIINGHIKKFTIYDKALTAQEVSLL